MRFNPFGPQKETRECAFKIDRALQDRKITKVCGYNYVIDYEEGRKDLLVCWARINRRQVLKKEVSI